MRTLTELLSNHQMFHSQFQQDNLITKRAGGTLYGQYKQALRELYKRTRGLREDWYQLEKTKNKIKQLQAKEQLLLNEVVEKKGSYNNMLSLEADVLKIKIEKIQLDIKHSEMTLEEQNRSLRETFRELKRFYAQADWLQTQLEEKHGKLTKEKINELDIDMWMYRIKEMIAIDMVYQGRMLNTTYEFLVALPVPLKTKIITQLKNEGPTSFVDWYETAEEEKPQIPEDLPEPTVQDLLTAAPVLKPFVAELPYV